MSLASFSHKSLKEHWWYRLIKVTSIIGFVLLFLCIGFITYKIYKPTVVNINYDYQGALDAGANPVDLMNYLAKQTDYNAQGAISAGANIYDVIRYMSQLPLVSQDNKTKITGSWFEFSEFFILYELIAWIIFLLIRMGFIYILTGEIIWNL